MAAIPLTLSLTLTLTFFFVIVFASFMAVFTVRVFFLLGIFDDPRLPSFLSTVVV